MSIKFKRGLIIGLMIFMAAATKVFGYDYLIQSLESIIKRSALVIHAQEKTSIGSNQDWINSSTPIV